MPFIKKNQIPIFFAVALAISASIAAIAHVSDNGGLAILTVLSPTMTALIIALATSGWQGFKDLTVGHIFRRFNWRWLLVSVLVFPAIVVLLQAIFLGAPFQLEHTDLMPYLVVVLVISLGEEFGWRAFAMPRLMERHSVLVSGAIIGTVWALWHFPGALIGQGTPEKIPFLLFALWVIGAGIFMGWVYANTRSVIPAILLHSSMNFGFIYSPLLPDKTDSLWPFAVLTAIIWAIVFILISFGKMGSLRQATNEKH